jgi:hypothetical protein
MSFCTLTSGELGLDRVTSRSGYRGRRSRAARIGCEAAAQLDYRRLEAMDTTWKPHEKHGELTERSDLPDSVFAFPKERREPLTDATHVRNAIARFDQVTDVSDNERALAFANIKQAADYYGVNISESDWEDLGSRPHTGRTAEDRRESARAAVQTKRDRGELS